MGECNPDLVKAKSKRQRSPNLTSEDGDRDPKRHRTQQRGQFNRTPAHGSRREPAEEVVSAP